MTRPRPFLIWLCCVLVLWAGLPLPGQGADDSATQRSCQREQSVASAVTATPVVEREAAPHCCGAECHCLERGGVERACDCKSPRPEPAPVAPAPRLVQALLLDEPTAWTTCSLPPVPQPERVGAVRPTAGLLPHVSRQKALSVWNC
ncbi:MAG: hypothetical protein H6838_01340 [Planctomycetes bacterium]|nr:hypothetical protein [Planctomycetota bacterium]